MTLERTKVLAPTLYERSEHSVGYGNAYTQKTVASRLGKIALIVPRRRDVELYSTALELAARSERASKCALAEMNVQGVSTREVAATPKELCGFEVSSSQFSRTTALLDEELRQWRIRELGDVPFILLDARFGIVRSIRKLSQRS